jgi:hypothetical protein
MPIFRKIETNLEGRKLNCDVTILYFAHFSRDFALLLPDIEKNMFLNYT